MADSELLPFLIAESLEERAETNHRLAEACWSARNGKNLEHARTFIRRAWLLRRFSAELLPLYTEIHSALNDFESIRQAYKRSGMLAAARADILSAIQFFNAWQYTYTNFLKLDKYEYDFDILERMDALAQPYAFNAKSRSVRNRPIRVAYLVKGIRELGSILVRINLLFARCHDRRRIEPFFFVPESEADIATSPEGLDLSRRFEAEGCPLIAAPKLSDPVNRLIAVGKSIYRSRPDILVTSAALATFDHYFLTALRPAPITIGLVQGPPQQFAPLNLDWAIAWSRHPLMDCPVGCTLVDMELELPERTSIAPASRQELQIPEDAVVVASAGRYVKFQEPEFWRAVDDLLRQNPEIYYLVLGAEESQIPALTTTLIPDTRRRCRFIGWKGGEYLRMLLLADIILDTFPSGGGSVLGDALSLGIPFVAFANDYLRPYDQTDWSPADEFGFPEMIVPRGDFKKMKEVLTTLVKNSEKRRALGEQARQEFRTRRGNPERAIRKIEDVYAQIVARKRR